MNMLADPGTVFESLNGVQVVLTLFFIIFLVSYIIKEAERDNLTLRQWLGTPIRYQVAISLLVTSVGSGLVRFVAWSWRFHGTGDFSKIEVNMLLIGVVLSTIGVLCMIRVFTRPFYGNWPWLLAATGTALYLFVEVFLRGQ